MAKVVTFCIRYLFIVKQNTLTKNILKVYIYAKISLSCIFIRGDDITCVETSNHSKLCNFTTSRKIFKNAIRLCEGSFTKKLKSFLRKTFSINIQKKQGFNFWPQFPLKFSQTFFKTIETLPRNLETKSNGVKQSYLMLFHYY